MKHYRMLISVTQAVALTVLLAWTCPAENSGLGVGQPVTRDQLRQQQAKDLQDLRNSYDGRARREVPRNSDGSIKTDCKAYEDLLKEYKQKSGEIKEKYRAQDPIAGDFDPKNKIEGVKSTGSKPKDVRADGDWSADSPEAAQKKLDQWKKRNNKIADEGYKKRNTSTDEVLWDSEHANDPRKVSDPDAYSTAGGKEKIGAGGVKDAKGYVLDNEKKYLDGKERGNLKDQAKSVSKAGEATGRANAPENADIYNKAKELQNYGDDATARISALGDSPAVRDQKLKDFQAKQDAEIEANKVEAAKASDAKQQVRENLADSAKKAETTGNSEWDKARNKANYGDTPTTSEAIGDRHAQVKDSNKAAEDFNSSLRDKVEGKNSKTTDGVPDSAKQGTSGTDVTEAKGSKSGSDMPETVKSAKTSSPSVDATDAPKGLFEGPEGTGGAKVPGGSGLKGAIIKGVNVAGEGMNAVDILSTAKDVQTDIQNGDYKGAATKTVEAAANQATLGTYGAVKSTGEKVLDGHDAQNNIDQANKMNEQNYDQKSAMALQKAGVNKDEIKQILAAKANGDESALNDKFKQLGVKAPEKIVEKGLVGDDSAGERAEAVAKGMADNAKKAATFVNDAYKNLSEIDTGMREKGVASEVASQTKENAKGWYDVFKERNKPEEIMAENKQALVDKLIARGATPDGAQKAADAMFDQGDGSKYKKLTDMLNKRNSANSLSDKEGKSDGDSVTDKGDGKADGKSLGLLDQVASAKDFVSREKTQAGMDGMQETLNGEKASTSGDKETREAASTVSKAGADAGASRDQSTRDTAQAQNDNSLGKKLGDAVENSITKGGESFASAIGTAGANKVNDNVYKGDRKDRSQGDLSGSSDSPQPVNSTGSKKISTGSAQAASNVNNSSDAQSPSPQDQGTPNSMGTGDGQTSNSNAKPANNTAKNDSGSRTPDPATPVPTGDGSLTTKSQRPVVKESPDGVQHFTCPACQRPYTGPAGTVCPYCVTMSCPVCGYRHTYDRGTQPPECPRCAEKEAAPASASSAAASAAPAAGGK